MRSILTAAPSLARTDDVRPRYRLYSGCPCCAARHPRHRRHACPQMRLAQESSSCGVVRRPAGRATWRPDPEPPRRDSGTPNRAGLGRQRAKCQERKKSRRRGIGESGGAHQWVLDAWCVIRRCGGRRQGWITVSAPYCAIFLLRFAQVFFPRGTVFPLYHGPSSGLSRTSWPPKPHLLSHGFWIRSRNPLLGSTRSLSVVIARPRVGQWSVAPGLGGCAAQDSFDPKARRRPPTASASSIANRQIAQLKHR